MEQAWVIPTLFEKDHRLAGSKVKTASGKDGSCTSAAPPATGPTTTCTSTT